MKKPQISEEELWASIQDKVKSGELDAWKLYREAFEECDPSDVGYDKFVRHTIDAINEIIFDVTGLSADDIEDGLTSRLELD